MEIQPIAYFKSPLTSKFGIPRQSGLVPSLCGQIVFAPEYRDSNALKGIEGFDWIWLIWEFSANSASGTAGQEWSPTVRPPRLGGNKTIGVFASRSPFRPNRLGLSSVLIDHIDLQTTQGPVIYVRGADLMDGTPIYDIKPYVEYADSHPGVRSGFVDDNAWQPLEVVIPDEMKAAFVKNLPAGTVPDLAVESLKGILAQDPRPHYQKDPEKEYGMNYAGMDIHFKVAGNNLTIKEIVKLKQ